jgi:Asp-tRNA(Asn)/Glu-tRNA(Gln) amidotransferase A subunit family amidase
MTHPELLSDYMRKMLDEHSTKPREPYAAAMQHARECRQIFTGLFTDIDVLLTPSAPDEAPIGIDGTGSSLFNRNWTLLGVPCVTIPAGKGAAELPLGVQFVGSYDDDERVLRCAQWGRRALD